MAIALYMNQHVPRAITIGLRLRGVDVITAYEDGASTMDDPELLDRGGELDRVLFTQDDDLLVEATKRQREGIPFRGVIFMLTNCVFPLGFEERYGMDFEAFKQAWDEGHIADKYAYEVERDYWEWEAAVTDEKRLHEMLEELTDQGLVDIEKFDCVPLFVD